MANGIFELSSLSAATGFAINGIAINNRAGWSVATAGDVNGDGTNDIIIGAFNASPGNLTSAGQAYVVFGQTSFSNIIELSSLNGENGFAIDGVTEGDWAGHSVASAGDVNGDGINDIIIGAFGASYINGYLQSGQAYVIFGRSSFSSTLSLSSLNGANGFAIYNNVSPYAAATGWSVAAASDINGDGKNDIIIGAPYVDQVYIIFGRSSFSRYIELQGTTIIYGTANGNNAGWSVAAAKDVNGDGKNDIVIGAPYASPNNLNPKAGQVYVVFGSASFSSMYLSSLNGTNGFTINGISAYDHAGFSVASAGDINSDGKNDIIIGAPYATPDGRVQAGQAYVIFGKSSFSATLNLATLNGVNGVAINGIRAGDQTGYSVASAGNINGDGKHDVIIGSLSSDSNGQASTGQAYIVFGKPSFASSLELSSLNGVNGFIINGINSSDCIGHSVSSAGDIDGDGKNDIIIGSYSANANGKAQAGQVYVIYAANALLEAIETTGLQTTISTTTTSLSTTSTSTQASTTTMLITASTSTSSTTLIINTTSSTTKTSTSTFVNTTAKITTTASPMPPPSTVSKMDTTAAIPCICPTSTTKFSTTTSAFITSTSTTSLSSTITLNNTEISESQRCNSSGYSIVVLGSVIGVLAFSVIAMAGCMIYAKFHRPSHINTVIKFGIESSNPLYDNGLGADGQQPVYEEVDYNSLGAALQPDNEAVTYNGFVVPMQNPEYEVQIKDQNWQHDYET